MIDGRAPTLQPMPTEGGCWPTGPQVLLLRACVLEPDEARRAWAAWRAGQTLQAADHIAISLFPLVYRNLGEALPEPDLSTLKGIYRATWVRNQILFKGAASALGVLEEAGIPTLLLKGAGLAIASYADLGAREMLDVDVLVPLPEADRALAALTRAGWITDERGRLKSEHGQPLTHPRGHQLDLHWFSLARSGPDEGFWERSVPVELQGVPTRTLCPADQLLQIAAHGGEWGAIPPVRWMADAAVIERSARADGLDWDVFVAEAIGRRLTVSLVAMLEHAADAVELSVPPEVLDRLREAPKGRLEHRIHRTATRRNGGGNWWLVELERFQRRARLDPTLRYEDFLKDHFGVATRRELIVPVTRKAGSVALHQARRLVRRGDPG